MKTQAEQIFDTQLVSFAIKGDEQLPFGFGVSSISACELLLMQSTNPSQASYYVPLPSKIGAHWLLSNATAQSGTRRRDHAYSRSTTDRILIDFANDYPAIIEYGALAISQIVNQRQAALFNESIRHLQKDKKKTIKTRFSFLLDQGATCLPLSKGIVRIALELLYGLPAKFSLKSNFRNSFNDLLIYATALYHSAKLESKDSLLQRIMIDRFQPKVVSRGAFAELDFSISTGDKPPTKADSKGYVNRSWRIQMYRYPTAEG
jgi:predicted nucleic acid-binding protein